MSAPTNANDQTLSPALERRIRQLEMLAGLGVTSLRGASFDRLLDEAVRLTAEGMQAEFCKVLEHRPAEHRFLVRAGVGWEPGVVGVATIEDDVASPAGFALRTGQPVISNQLDREERFRTPELLMRYGIRRAMNVILQGEGRPYGVLEVDSPSEAVFDQRDIAFLQGAANILGMAIEHQQYERKLVWLASIVESSDDAIVSKNLDGVVTSWNNSAQRIFGYLAEEAIGKPITIIIPPERHREEDMILGRIRRGERVDHFETVRQRKDGVLVDISLTISPVRDPEGTIVGASKIARDITERKRSEARIAALAREARQQADLLDQSQDAILAWKIGGGITYWNRGAEELYGYTSKEAVGRVSHELLRTRSNVPDQERETQTAETGSWYGELTHTRRDGREIVVESRHVRVSYDGDLYALETNRDITARKRAEEELRKSEERFSSSILHSPMPTILFDDQEQILAISQSWLEAAGGISAAELQRMKDWTIRAYGERSDEILELIRGIIATEPEARTDEQMILTRRGDKRVWNFVTSSLGTKSDGRRLFVSVAQDVTDQKAYEERIHLLMREARHRTKNILGLVQAIARQTATGDAQEFVSRFTERIQALAANQDLLVQHEWQQIDVRDLVQVQLGHFADLIGTRINFEGPKLHLNAAAAQAIGLALHELATNAGKYGALSTDAGLVDVSWQLDDDIFMMSWIERRGPPVRPPERRGFGSTVMESLVKQTLNGEVQLNYASSGLEWRLTCHSADALEKEGKKPAR
jgi:PAS domain S-box-containing protein